MILPQPRAIVGPAVPSSHASSALWHKSIPIKRRLWRNAKNLGIASHCLSRAQQRLVQTSQTTEHIMESTGLYAGSIFQARVPNLHVQHEQIFCAWNFAVIRLQSPEDFEPEDAALSTSRGSNSICSLYVSANLDLAVDISVGPRRFEYFDDAAGSGLHRDSERAERSLEDVGEHQIVI